MDDLGPLPLSLADLSERLEAGQVFTIESSGDGFSYVWCKGHKSKHL